MHPALIAGDVVITMKPGTTGPVDSRLDLSHPDSFYLVSLKDGHRNFFRYSNINVNNPSFSPNGNGWFITIWTRKTITVTIFLQG